jgi:ADP-ribose pyrophosphatase YjhB (NUDIX family)
MENKLSFLKEASSDTKISVGVGVIVAYDGLILLEQREDCGMWGCPGGRIDPGENITQTAIRETKEETNIDIEVERIFGIYSDPKYGTVRRYRTDSYSQQIIDIYLLARPLTFDIEKSPESLDVRFFELDKPLPNITPYATEVIDDYKRDTYNTCTVLK